MNDLTVVLLCHNRPNFAVEAIESIMRQSNSSFDFLVSDNSTNDQLQKVMKADFPAIKTILWESDIASHYDHFNKIIAHIETKYVVLFNDDDLMSSNYVMRILQQFKETPNAVAISVNGSFIDEKSRRVDHSGGHFSFMATENSLVFNDSRTLVERYLTEDSGSVAPFSSYTYNLKKIKDLRLDFNRGGNYCDTVFLMDVANRGAIVWINEPLVQTRVHEERLSTKCGVRDYKGFIATILQGNYGKINQFFIDEYRFRHLFYQLRIRKRFPAPALKFIFRMISLLIIRSPAFRKKVFTRLFRR